MTDLQTTYRNRSALVTGHTGFKGSWLAFWLTRLGTRVVGYSLAPPTDPAHWPFLKLDVPSIAGDIRDSAMLAKAFAEYQPEIVFHLAAQPLVRRSYREPEETYSTNVGGTLAVLEAARKAGSVQAFVCVTSDKVYENWDSPAGHVETDRLGGHDPYSSSKACCELLAASYRQSFLAEGKMLLATVRAGNVLGGGDWADDRLLPDAVRAVAKNEPMVVRSPRSVRPWQHVLEPLAGYLRVGQKLLEGDASAATAWNFGPADEGNVEAGTVVRRFQRAWPKLNLEFAERTDGPHETAVLKLNSSKAARDLGWQPAWGWEAAVDRAAGWYRTFVETGKLLTTEDLAAYVAAAKSAGMEWVA
ncbi:MAG TPA: CDP-glucose 4,6-dehydratase [Fimbriiglobus sp.]